MCSHTTHTRTHADKYIEPRVGQRVRLCALQIRHVRQKGIIDVSLGTAEREREKEREREREREREAKGGA